MTNEHVVERAADLKIEVTTNDGKSFNGRYITGDPKKDLAFIKIDATSRSPLSTWTTSRPISLARPSSWSATPLGYGSSISRGVLSGMKRDITIDNNDYQESAANGRRD